MDAGGVVVVLRVLEGDVGCWGGELRVCGGSLFLTGGGGCWVGRMDDGSARGGGRGGGGALGALVSKVMVRGLGQGRPAVEGGGDMTIIRAGGR